MASGSNIKNIHLGSKYHTIPEPHFKSSPSMEASSLAEPSSKKRKKFDPTKELVVSIVGEMLLPSWECSQRCTFFFKEKNDAEGFNWEKVTEDTKDFYWKEFKNLITHPGFSEKEAYVAWVKKASIRYDNWMYDMQEGETKPNKIEQCNWDQWSNYWKTDEFREKSNLRKRKIWDRQRNEMINFFGGSQTYEMLLEMMENGIDPQLVEFYKLTHTRKDDGKIFRDDSASQLYADYCAKELEESGSSSPVHQEKADNFKEVVGGENKGVIYGLTSVLRKILF